jgi:hypothetical protein
LQSEASLKLSKLQALIGGYPGASAEEWVLPQLTLRGPPYSIIVSSFFKHLQSIHHVSGKLIQLPTMPTTRFLAASRLHNNSRLICVMPENSS